MIRIIISSIPSLLNYPGSNFDEFCSRVYQKILLEACLLKDKFNQSYLNKM